MRGEEAYHVHLNVLNSQKSLTMTATSHSLSPRLKIGISACFFHPNEERSLFKGKTLQYIEQSVAHWIMSQGDLAVMIPSPEGNTQKGDVQLGHYAEWLDALVLMGGSDVWPGSYGETAMNPQWEGDRIRDEYDKGLIDAFVKAGKPVLGICRGLQIINVAFGGTLYQDIATQRPDAISHRNSDTYDGNLHEVQFEANSKLSKLLGGATRAKVNSIHHQGIKDLAPQFQIEAFCPHDKIPEAIRLQGQSYVAAIQWHPEFHKTEQGTLDDSPMLQDFLNAARIQTMQP
jgi:putative glutamine amidotransferase